MVVVLFWVVLYPTLCGLVAVWAANKGRNSFLAFLASFILSPLIGFAIVATLKDKKQAANIAEEQQLTIADSKVCPACAEIIKAGAQICRFCMTDVSAVRPIPPTTNEMACPSCGQPVKVHDVICLGCGSTSHRWEKPATVAWTPF
jgi:RNA polymerase subunit RPABC4/transcription elongation factor Spt4